MAVNMDKSTSRRFAIALSFPGDKRGFVEKVAECLSEKFSKNRILYDDFHESEFALLDLDVYLPGLYRTQSELIVIFLCEKYKEKQWCKLEWRHIKQFIASRDQGRIMLLNFDDSVDFTDLGILPGDGYISIRSRKPNEIAELILQRYNVQTSQGVPELDVLPPGNTEDLHSNLSPDKGEKQPSHFYGEQRKKHFNFFLSEWLKNGPAVAILQGVPGCGKTQLARDVAQNSDLRPIFVLPQAESPDPVTELFTELAEALSDYGIFDLKQGMDRGPDADLFNQLFTVLRREKIFVIIDEYQRFFPATKTYPPKKWQTFIERLNNNPNTNGRLLILSNRAVMTARWSESCALRKLSGLTDTEAAAFLLELLGSADLTEEIESERLEEIGHRLGGNPRALKTLVGSLKYDTLDNLLSLAPDLFIPGDVNLDPHLVEDFERALIERALPEMDNDLLSFMRFMAVHRRPFTKEAFAEFNKSTISPKELRRQLIDRFLWDFSFGYDSIHPLAREISVSRLRAEKEEWREAHSLAANYHFRFFKATRQGGARRMAASYAELRHHLFEANRISELHLASEKLTRFALSQITKPIQSKVPENVEILEERIALISALPDKDRPKGLEYHLALCLKHRNIGDDYRNALGHVRKAVGQKAYYAVWLLLIELEYTINGIEAMLNAQKRALKFLGGGSNSFSVYLRCAQLLVKDSRLQDAIEVLEDGINTPGVTCLSSLISRCSQYMEEAGKFDDAIRILKKGIDTPDIPELGTLYLRCADLLAKTSRTSDAIELLKRGIKIDNITKRYSFYLNLADFLVKAGKDEEAIYWLKEGIADSRVIDPKNIYRACAELLVKNQQFDEAVEILEKGCASKAVGDPVPIYHSFAKIMEESNKSDEAVKFLKRALSTTRMSIEPSIYLACAKLLFHARKIDDAIEVLIQGVSVPKMKDKNHLYQMLADLTARQGRLDDAIKVLEKGIGDKDQYTQFSLYKLCSELMVKAGRLEDAIALMKRGINSPAQSNKAVLYQTCAKLLAKAGRTDEGIKLLENAMRIPGLPGMVHLYQTCAQLMSKTGRRQDAIRLLKKEIIGPKIGNLVSLYQLCGELLMTANLKEEAVSLLKKGLKDYPRDKNLKAVFNKASKKN